MAALSPRSTNLPTKLDQTSKKDSMDPKVASLRNLQREKDHPPPPPPLVREPNTSGGCKGEEYVIGRPLGKGGFAICYEGQSKGTKETPPGRRYALKIVKAAMPQPKLADKFKTELQIHSKMHHPHIVEFHRAFTFGESTYVVLELCNNGSLMEMVKHRKFLSEPEVRRYVIQICGAIKYLHYKNVIHRDLKMGNIFLDENMNVKIGDFGLAALLLSDSEYSLNRRRTMCGTPNYIAPEVLSKTYKGHDRKVDLWSLGIIIFAMLAGYPPFQSKTQEEIYRKVKARAYGWPTNDTCSNIISQLAKDVVSALLVDATERPEPDEIVSLPFFKSGLIPDRISPSAKQTPPIFQDWTPQTGLSKEAWRHRQWNEICRKCGVGITDQGQEIPNVGGELHKSTYKECLLEEKVGLYPIIPMPDTVVYRRFNASEFGPLPDEKQLMPGSFPESPEKKPPAVGDRATIIDPVPYPAPLNVVRHAVQVQPIVKRQEPRSHAAQLRERDQPKRRVQEAPKGVLKWDADGKGLAYQKEGSTASGTATLSGKPVRLNSRTAKSVAEQPTLTRLTRSQASQSQASQTAAGIQTAQIQAPPEKPPSGISEGSSIKTTATSAPLEKPVGGKPEGTSTKASAASAPREGKRSVSQEPKSGRGGLSSVDEALEVEEKPVRKTAPKPAPTTKASSKPRHASTTHHLIDPKEPASLVPHSQGREVQIRLTVMLDSLRTALRRKQPSSRPAVRRTTTLPLVIKWVDYSNKFGIGYTLNDGSMGCLLNSENGGPSTGVFVRGNIDRPSHAGGKGKKEPSIPLYGRPIELFENCGEKGFKHLQIKPEEYQAYLGGSHEDKKEDGKSTKPRHFSPSEQRKRRAILLWARFANYMRDALAKSGSDAIKKSQEEGSEGQSGVCVLFYQRLGNVGIWGFDDGSFQFNFPDHTKIILSEGATHFDFYHLALPDAVTLSPSSGGTANANIKPTTTTNNTTTTTSSSTSPSNSLISTAALNSRGIISSPVRDFVAENVPNVAKANQLAPKLNFVTDIVRQWLSFGGLGKIDPERRLMWGNDEGSMERMPSSSPPLGDGRASSEDGSSSGNGNEKKGGKGNGEIDEKKKKNEKENKAEGPRSAMMSGGNGVHHKPVWVSIGAPGGDARYT